MGILSTWTEADEQLFEAQLSEEARKRLARSNWDGRERRSSYHQSTRKLVADLLAKHPRWPVVER